MQQATEGRKDPAGAGPCGEPPGLVLLEPERPHNLGAAIRLCACLGVPLHVVGPTGFPLSDRRIREAALDYGAHLTPVLHRDAASFCAWAEGAGRRLVLLSAKGATPYHHAIFRDGDLLLLGNERYGAPDWLHARAALVLRVPMAPARRALNLVVAGAIVLGEALRVTGRLDALAGGGPTAPGPGASGGVASAEERG